MIKKFEVFPGYYGGFSFLWEVDPNTKLKLPWSFQVEESETGIDDFEDISPAVVNAFAWQEPKPRKKFNKDRNLFFRVKMTSESGVCYSQARTATGDLPLKEYLYAREIMRKELLQMRNMAAVGVSFWRKMQTGMSCKNCLDPITQEIIDPDCPVCNGTKFLGGYHGPYYGFATFSVTRVHKKHAEDGAGVDDDRMHQVRMIGHPAMIRDDVIVDIAGDRRYIVDEVASELELRRIPIIQILQVHEAERCDIVHKLGEPNAPAVC